MTNLGFLEFFLSLIFLSEVSWDFAHTPSFLIFYLSKFFFPQFFPLKFLGILLYDNQIVVFKSGLLFWAWTDLTNLQIFHDCDLQFSPSEFGVNCPGLI